MELEVYYFRTLRSPKVHDRNIGQQRTNKRTNKDKKDCMRKRRKTETGAVERAKMLGRSAQLMWRNERRRAQ